MGVFWIIASASWAVSLLLIIKLWRSNDLLVFKVLISAIALIPVLGPILYLFTTDKTPPQERCLQNRGARGQYTHTWIGMRSLYKKTLKDKQAKQGEQGPNNT